MSADATAIVPAAGRGVRFGASGNKAFVPLRGRPILRWTLEALCACPDVAAIVVAVSPSDEPEAAHLAAGLGKPCRLTLGGASRTESVENALRLVETPLVAVHDAARPLIDPETVSRCLASAREHGTGLAAIRVADTLKREEGGATLETVPRESLWAAQTPQCFQTELLRRAYAAAGSGAVTDDSSLVQAIGIPVRLVAASTRNLKITTPDDLAVAEALVAPFPAALAPAPVRVGYGYDIHRFQEGRPLYLGGVRFDADFGLLGHSDADAVLHALMDALLGAAGLPDIGHLFPNTDERYRGASSMDLLAEVMRRVRTEGFTVGNADITVIAERPKIAPRVEEMKARIAGALGIAASAVGLKATTAEGLGDLGAGDGLAAHAVCVLVRTGP